MIGPAVDRLVALWSRALSHLRRQETSNKQTDQRPQDADYDDRDSVAPVPPHEQSIERQLHQSGAGEHGSEASHQRELVRWTRILAITTGTLAAATFLVASFAGWQVWEMREASLDTTQLAQAAKITADVSQKIASCIHTRLDRANTH